MRRRASDCCQDLRQLRGDVQGDRRRRNRQPKMLRRTPGPVHTCPQQHPRIVSAAGDIAPAAYNDLPPSQAIVWAARGECIPVASSHDYGSLLS